MNTASNTNAQLDAQSNAEPQASGKISEKSNIVAQQTTIKGVPWASAQDVVLGVVPGSAEAFEALIEIKQVVRVLESRRVVAQAKWGERAVYIKCFFGEDALRYAARDAEGSQLLLEAKIHTPKLLARFAWETGALLIYEEIVPSQNLEGLWRQASPVQQVKLMHRLLKVVASHHAAELIQTDMHFKNFLTRKERVEDFLASGTQAIFTLDGDGIRETSQHSRFLNNLASLLAKLDVMLLQLNFDALWQTYKDHCQFVPRFQQYELERMIFEQRYKQLSRYADEKVLRMCTEVYVRGHAGGGLMHFFARLQDAFLHGFPSTPKAMDAMMHVGGVLKAGNTNTVTRVAFNDRLAVVKRYNIKHFRHALNRGLRRSRAVISWSNAFRLQMVGIPTPAPWAVLETRYLGWRGRAYLVTEYVDALDLDTFFTETQDKKLRAQVVRAVVELLYKLYCLQISHGDFKASNIKVLADGRVMLIDLDSMQQHRFKRFALNAHVRDIKRLMRNWKDDTSLYNAFVKVFNVVYDRVAPLEKAHILNRHN